MKKLMHMLSLKSSEDALRWLLLAISSLVAGGCGTVDFKVGNSFDATLLESTLKPGMSSGAEVQAALGEPFGSGRALMPFHESPRTVWTYYFEQGSVAMGGGDSRDNRQYLFVFLIDEVYDGYMWFDSDL